MFCFHAQAVIDSGVCKRLVELLMSNHTSILSATVRAVGNIVTGDDAQTQVMLNCAALPCLMNLIANAPKETVRKEACWTVSNITAGNREQIQAVINANIIPVLVEVLAKAEYKTRKEAAWAVTNATSGGSMEQIRYMVSQGCIPPLCDLLRVNDAKIVNVALTGLTNILKYGEQESRENPVATGGHNPYAVMIEECYGLDKIEALQNHDNEELYQKAFSLIEKYFGSDDVADEVGKIAPALNPEGQFQFGGGADPAAATGFSF